MTQGTQTGEGVRHISVAPAGAWWVCGRLFIAGAMGYYHIACLRSLILAMVFFRDCGCINIHDKSSRIWC